MSNKPTPNPVDIAREVFQLLATRRVAPTPEAYRQAYEEIAGTSNGSKPENVLAAFALHLTEQTGDLRKLGQRLFKAMKNSDWKGYGAELDNFIWQYFPSRNPVPHGELAPIDLEREFIHDSKKEKMLRETLARVLSFNLASLLQPAPELANESRTIGNDLKTAFSEQTINDVISRIKQMSFQIELKKRDIDGQQELLMRLFQLLLENIHGLLEKGSWLSSQITVVQELITGPISTTSLADATRTLKEVIYKQGLLKHTLAEEKITAKNLMLTFVERLGAMVLTTDNYHKTITDFSQQISQASDLSDLNSVLTGIMNATKDAQDQALLSRDEMQNARQEMQKAEARIQMLESQLQHMGELVREDPLTGSLNQRGMDEILAREMLNAERRNTPLCIALLDLDDFKRINDTHGHATGDEVLVHLATVVKDTLRKLDVIARFGGEEFLVLLPETEPAEAMQIITRVQRELTGRIFMHDTQRLLITFSAGIACRAPGEEQADLIKRADLALDKAKNAGKNRVILADARA